MRPLLMTRMRELSLAGVLVLVLRAEWRFAIPLC